MSNKLGLDAELYRNRSDATYDDPVWNAVENVKDLTLNLESGEADVTTRGNNGWRATLAGLKDGSIEFQMVWDTGDPDFAAIKNAWLNKTAIEFAVMSGDITDPESEGLRASFSIIKFTRNEPLEEAITVDVTAKPTYAANAPEWITGSGGMSSSGD